jgi:uncharacterized membrane protein (Fun14 family)
MSINESFVLSATAMGGGDFFVAVLIEYALKKVIKILAVIVWYFIYMSIFTTSTIAYKLE